MQHDPTINGITRAGEQEPLYWLVECLCQWHGIAGTVRAAETLAAYHQKENPDA